MNSLLNLSIRKLLALYKKREVSCTEIMQQCLNHVRQSKKLNCFINIYESEALQQAKKSDENWQRGTQRVLEGVPIGVKNCFCVKGTRMTCGSKMLQEFIAPYTATTIHKLTTIAGAINVGDTNLDEFTLGSSNETSYFGPVVNPWRDRENNELVPGGSSGGSAAAVASRLTFAATGTDSGGSIRQPAAFTGVVGIKPTYGLCSRFGVFAYASSVDHPGVLARDVYDCALLLEHMAGYDPQDSTSLKVDIPRYTEALTGDIKGKTVAIPQEVIEHSTPDLIEDMHRVSDILTKLGAKVEYISLPLLEYALTVYYVVAPSEGASNFARYDGIRYGYRSNNKETLNELYCNSRIEGLGREVKRRILMGTYLTSNLNEDVYIRGQEVRAAMAKDVNEVLEKADVILMPTTGGEAFQLHSKTRDPVKMYLNDYFTAMANLLGTPAVSVPIGLGAESGLPRAVQFMGNHLQESMILNFAYALEREIGTMTMPDWWWRKHE